MTLIRSFLDSNFKNIITLVFLFVIHLITDSKKNTKFISPIQKTFFLANKEEDKNCAHVLLEFPILELMPF